MLDLALEHTDLSPRELACRYTDEKRYIISWKLSPTMDAGDVKDTLDDAISITGVDPVKVRHRPRLLSDCSATTAQRTSRVSFVIT